MQKIGDSMYEIHKKAIIYKVLDPKLDKQMAQAWRESITDGIIEVLVKFFHKS